MTDTPATIATAFETFRSLVAPVNGGAAVTIRSLLTAPQQALCDAHAGKPYGITIIPRTAGAGLGMRFMPRDGANYQVLTSADVQDVPVKDALNAVLVLSDTAATYTFDIIVYWA